MKITVLPHGDDPTKACEGFVKEVTLTELHSQIFEASYSAFVFKDNYRLGENFLSADFMVVDIDDGLSYLIAMERLKGLKLKYSLSFSKNHQKQKGKKAPCDRYHIIIPLEDRILDHKVYLSTWEKLRESFPESDRVVKDKARFFYKSVHHSVDGAIIQTEGNSLELVFKTGPGQPKKDKNTPAAASYTPLILSPTLHKWIVEAPSGLDGIFNHTLYGAAKDLIRQISDEEQMIEFLQRFSPEPFDHTDLTTIRSAIQSADAIEYPRDKHGKLTQSGINEFIKENFSNKYLTQMDDEFARGAFLEHLGEQEYRVVSEDKLIYDAAELLDGYEKHFLSAKALDGAIKTWKARGPTIPVDKIQPISFIDDPAPCYKRVRFDIEEQPTPLFDEMMSRTDGAEDLMAFTWSLLIKDSYKQQYLYWMGEGGVGKSSYVLFLDHFLGRSLVSLRSEGAAGNRFWSSGLVGASVGVFADTNHSSFMSSGIFKSISGGDKINIEFKNCKPYSMVVPIKFMFLANEIPQLGNESQDTRRLLLIKTSSLSTGTLRDPKYVDKLIAEAPGWFFKCKQAYEKACPTHGHIEGDDTQKKVMEEFYLAEFHRIFNEYFTASEDCDILKQAAIHKAASHDLTRRGIKMDKFRKFMKSKYNVQFDDKRLLYVGIKLK